MSLSPTPTPECCFVFQEHVALCACVLLSDPPPCLGTSGMFLVMGRLPFWDCSFKKMNPVRPQLGVIFYFQGNSKSILEDFKKL